MDKMIHYGEDVQKKLNSGIIRRRIINNLEGGGGDNSKIDENT